MNFTLSRLAGLFFGYALFVQTMLAGEVVSEKPAEEAEVAPMPGIFNTELPRLLRPEFLRLSLRPHFGDFVHHDHLRITLGARYALTSQWELSGDTDMYMSHGLGGVPVGEETGFSKVRLGVKYNFIDFLRPYWTTAVGLKYTFPVGNPPPDLTDGLHHITPYMTLAHQWESRPAFTTFVSYGLDFVTQSDVRGTIEDGGVDANTWFITPGVVWHRGAFDYSLETVFTSTAGLDSNENYRVTLRPGVKWTLPPGLTFHSRSRWVVGVSAHADYGSTGSNFGTSLRLETNFDFKRLFKGSSRSGVDAAK